MAYDDHSWYGTVFNGGYAAVTTIEGDIYVPRLAPHVDDFYYVLYSIYDSSMHYDQIGFAATGGVWGVTWAALGSCGTTGTWGVDFDDNAFTLVAGLSYHFRMQIGGGIVTYTVSRLGQNLWQHQMNTGGQYFQREGTTWCGFPPIPYRGYTDYVEVYTVEREQPPYWNFDFGNNVAGGAVISSWSTFTDGTLPSTPNEPAPFTTVGSGGDAGDVFVWNEWFKLTTDVPSLQITQGTTSAGTWGTVVLNQAGTWSTNCQGGGPCAVTLSATVPSGWSASFAPNPATPTFVYSITLAIPSNAAIGNYVVVIHAQRPSGLFTEEALTVVVIAGGGGGGCVAKNTLVLTSTGYAKVQNLEADDLVMGYDLSSESLVELTLVSITESTQTHMVDINEGALILTAVNQPLYVLTASGAAWLADPQNLSVGDFLFDAAEEQWIHVSSVAPFEKAMKVYDLETSDPNNFIANSFLLDKKDP